MMSIISTIVMLLGFAFGIFGVIGLFSPSKGGFWMKFLKKPNRFKVFGLNLVMFIVLLLVGIEVDSKDSYAYGNRMLESKNYTAALEAYNELKSGNKHFDEKESLIKSVYDDAKSHYTTIIDEAFPTLDIEKINNANNDYKLLAGDILVSEDDLNDKIENQVSIIQSDIANLMAKDDFDNAIVNLDILDKVSGLHDYVTATKTQINNIKSTALRNEIADLMAAKDYSTVRTKLTELKSIEGDSDYITDIRNKINDALYKEYIDQINSYIKNAQFNEARDVVKKIMSLNVSEEKINSLQTQITDIEKDYLAKKEKAELDAYRKDATVVRYGTLLRNPDEYTGKVVYIVGEIEQEIDDGEYKLATEYVDYVGYMNDPVVFKYYQSGIIVGDIVQIYGVFNGIKEYNLANGGSLEVPVINARIVDISVAR